MFIIHSRNTTQKDRNNITGMAFKFRIYGIKV